MVKATTWLTHLEKEPYNLLSRHWVSELSRDHAFVRYDSRGCGMSVRETERISMEAWVEDLEAVVSTLDIDRFPLLGMSQGAAIATHYAARHPDRVSHLVLYGACARGLLKRNPPPEVVEAAPKVQRPTLVFHAKEDPCFPFEEGRLLASLTPNARFVPLASKNHLPFETEAAGPG